MDHEQIYRKLEKIDDKLDLVVERLAVVETKHRGMSGQIKFLFSIVLAAVVSGISAFWKYVLANLPH